MNRTGQQVSTADVVLGQHGLTATQPDRGGEPTVNTLYRPDELGVAAGHLWLTDTENHRALVRDEVPDAAAPPADIALANSTRSVAP